MTNTSDRATILIVEDDNFISTFLQNKFKEQYDTVSATTSKEAWEFVKIRPVHLILLDIMLPEENGLAFLQRLKSDQNYKNIPVVMLSNFDNEEYIKRSLDLGAIKYLVKANHTPAEIATVVAEILNEPTGEKPAGVGGEVG